jgi:PilZ domain
MLQMAIQRRAVRRAVQTSCQVVNMQAFELLSERVIDLSPRGMLVACDRATQIGDDMVVSFRAPGRDELWLDAEAVVARVVSGQRWGDAGYCAGLDFTYFEKTARQELLARLAGYPPPVPRRRLQSARQRMRSNSVVVRPIIMLDDEPIIPLTRVRTAPRGVFA